MDYSLLVGIHDCSKEGEPPNDVFGSSPPGGGGPGDSSEPDAGSVNSNEYGSNPTPPDSPVHRRCGVFAPLPSDAELVLDDEFYAIHSRSGILRRF